MKVMHAWIRSINWPTVITSLIVSVVSCVMLNYSEMKSNLLEVYDDVFQMERWSGSFSNTLDFVDGVDMERRGFGLRRKEVIHFEDKSVNGEINGYIDVSIKDYPLKNALFDGKINLFGNSADISIYDIVSGSRKEFCKAKFKMLDNAIEVDSGVCPIMPSGKFARHPVEENFGVGN